MFVARRQKAITWTNVDFSSKVFNWEQFHKELNPRQVFRNYTFRITAASLTDQWVKFNEKIITV